MRSEDKPGESGLDVAEIERVLREMRERKINHGKHTSPTLIAWAARIEQALGLAAPTPSAGEGNP